MEEKLGTEVAATKAREADLSAGRNSRVLGIWLLAVAATVFVMVVVGGATRLTESGLSIVDWRPVTGVLPPIGDAAWQAEFSKYQTSPEFRLKNSTMTVEEFKGIFYWEWGHRLLGRLIGIVYFLPLLVFWIKGMVPAAYRMRLVLLFFLGGAQGALGWYMVASGLVDEPAVSHYRLTAHLSLALVIFSLLFWTGLEFLSEAKAASGQTLTGRNDISREDIGLWTFLARMMLFLVAVQIIFGALVAGLKAGYIYNEWPLMGDEFVPSGLFALEPVWVNFVDNAATVQFIHRLGAYLVVLASLIVFVLARRSGHAINRRIAHLLLASVSLQALIGIVTLVKFVPVGWGTLHQAGGVIVLSAVLYFNFAVMIRAAGKWPEQAEKG